MDFGAFMGKHVRITFTDGEFLEGIPYCFSGADDNPEGVASIRVGDYELYENEISSIEVVSTETPSVVQKAV